MNKFHILKFYKINILFSIFLLCISCTELSDIHIENAIMFEGRIYKKDEKSPFSGFVYNLYSNGQLEYKGKYKDGKPNGNLIYWYDNGQKMREGKLKDGVPVGQWDYFNSDGSHKKIIMY